MNSPFQRSRSGTPPPCRPPPPPDPGGGLPPPPDPGGGQSPPPDLGAGRAALLPALPATASSRSRHTSSARSRPPPCRRCRRAHANSGHHLVVVVGRVHAAPSRRLAVVVIVVGRVHAAPGRYLAIVVVVGRAHAAPSRLPTSARRCREPAASPLRPLATVDPSAESRPEERRRR
uniref:Uncharacterized protein n=1 Tax=Oryza sativa subsp. japonica TaxID=39947 RepID=Q6Z5P9_ORYSJ|nr:hypothetical protein [Oryza sativa Japonica Group]